MLDIILSIFIVILGQSVLGTTQELDLSSENVPEDATLYFEELAIKYGHPALKYEVITEDGYILALYNLPGTKRVPLLLMHGLHGTSDIWMLRGNISLPIALANAGYDVWIGNNRGNRYARRHLSLDPDYDPAFWDFSFHEMGIYDLPAIIDTVILKTGAKKINAMGHSLGNTLFYVLGSNKPEYNEKVNILIALAPIFYMDHVPSITGAIAKLSPIIGMLMNKLNMYELFDKPMRDIAKVLCYLPVLGYEICVEKILFTMGGNDPEELSPEFSKIAFSHFPSSSSVKNLVHTTQIHIRGEFAHYDYGSQKNSRLYNSSVPPEYDLGKVTMPIALTVGRNDKLSDIEDVKKLMNKLPNVVSFELSSRKEFNHMDCIWGAHMDVYLHPYVFKILDQYS